MGLLVLSSGNKLKLFENADEGRESGRCEAMRMFEMDRSDKGKQEETFGHLLSFGCYPHLNRQTRESSAMLLHASWDPYRSKKANKCIKGKGNLVLGLGKDCLIIWRRLSALGLVPPS